MSRMEEALPAMCPGQKPRPGRIEQQLPATADRNRWRAAGSKYHTTVRKTTHIRGAGEDVGEDIWKGVDTVRCKQGKLRRDNILKRLVEHKQSAPKQKIPWQNMP
jgi:hypothetical protein